MRVNNDRPEPNFQIGKTYSNGLQCIQHVSERRRGGRTWYEAKLPPPFRGGNRIAGSGHTPLEAFNDAVNKYAELRDSVERLTLDGEALTHQRYTLQDVVDLFLAAKTDIVVPETEWNRKMHVKKCGALLKRDITTIRGSEWLAFFNSLKKPEKGKPLADAYVEDIYRTLQLILYFAKDRGILKVNPLDTDMHRRIKWNKDDSREREALTVSETRLILEYAKQRSPYVYHFMRILLTTGMRCGELVALEWSDLDFKAETIQINKTFAGKGFANMQLRPTKTKAGMRIIPMLPVVKEAFEYFAAYQKDYNCANTREIATYEGKTFKGRRVPNFVFTCLNCNPITVNAARQKVQRVLNRHNRDAARKRAENKVEEPADLRWFTVHELRNTCITRLWEQGIELTIVKAYVGHRIKDITFGRYTTRFAELLRLHLNDFDAEKEVDEKDILRRRNMFWYLGESEAMGS